MANARELLKRKKSVQSTGKITRTMEMVAAAKMRKAQDRAMASRPYAEALAGLVQRLSAGESTALHPLMEQREVRNVAILLCCSDRGLCAAFNSNLISEATKRYRHHREAGRNVRMICLGRKGASTLRFLGVEVDQAESGIMDSPRYEQAISVINPLIDDFLAQRLDAVEVVYSCCVTATSNVPRSRPLLPAGAADEGADDSASVPQQETIFHPDPEAILQELIPQNVRTNLFSCLLQTSAGEHAARRIAMKNASDAAKDLAKALGRSYNRARQTKITQEIAEIVGAVEAMA